MELNRARLVKDLSFFARGLGQNALFPIFQCFHIDGNKIISTDGTCMITGELENSTELKCAIPGSKMLDLLKSLSSEKIELSQRRDKVYIDTVPEKTTAKFLTVGGERVLEFPDYSKIKWGVIPEDFLKGLSACSFAVSNDETSGVLTGVYVVGGMMYGTDKYRAARFFLKDKFGFDAAVPVKFISTIKSCSPELSEMAVQEDVHSKKVYVNLKDGRVISSCLLEGTYPDLNQYFPDTKDMQVIEFTEDVKEIIERHVSFLSEQRGVDKQTELYIQDDYCDFTSTDPAVGRVNCAVRLKEKSVKEFKILLNPEFLKEVHFSKFYYDPEKGLVVVKSGALEYLVLERRV